MASRDIVIVGAGFSGLTLAYYLTKKSPHFNIQIIEAAPTEGGLLQSETTRYGLVEKAANAILDSEELRIVAKDIGIELLEASPKIKRAYILREGKLKSWPLNIFESFSFLFKAGPMFLIKRKYFPLPKESVAEWAEKTLGTKAANYLVDPALAGIYAAPTGELSATLILGRFFRSGAKKKKKIQSVAPLAGMSELAHKLKKYLERSGVVFHFNKNFSLAERSENTTVFCGSLAQAQKFLNSSHLAIKDHAEFFSLKMLPLSTTTLFFEKALPYRAFGILYPRVERRPFLGTLLNSFIFPQRTSKSAETWIGPFDAKVTDIYKERTELFQNKDIPIESHVTRWKEALPFYNRELEEFLENKWGSMREYLKSQNLYLHGNYLGKLGLSQLILNSSELANELVREGTA